MAYTPNTYRQQKLSVTGNTTFTIPANMTILQIVVENTTVNAVTGGIKIGTTDGGTEVVAALLVGANELTTILDATILKRAFSLSTDTTLYINTVTLWNSANLNFYFLLTRII